MAETIKIKGEGISLDLLLWRRFGVAGQKIVEKTLNLNPGLAALGAELPIGALVTLPDEPVASATAETAISLFD
jgi:phage tail protein X